MGLKIEQSPKEYTEHVRRLFQGSFKTARGVTFQITNQCNLRCSYCYEHNKCQSSMDMYTAKKCIDTIFDMYESDDSFVGNDTIAIVLDFIGGEPLLEATLIEQICDYYFHECYRRKIPLAPFSRISFATNGQLWFTPEAQHLFSKYHDFMSVTVSIDGIQELHDKYRIDQYGNGSFEKAYMAFLDGKKKYGQTNSKMTFVPNSIQYIYPSIKMMINNGCSIINANFAYEPTYSIKDAKNIYFELQKLSNDIIDNNIEVFISMLTDNIGYRQNLEVDNKNYCGGTGNMLAFAPDGNAYPCIRYTPVSIGKEKASKICIGDCYNGIYKTDNQKKIKEMLDSITFTSQSPQKCIDCPISQGCGWCSGHNYELYGTPNKRFTGICYAHKGRVLASCYYHCKRALEVGDVEPRKINLPCSEVEEIIGKEESDALFKLQDEAFEKKKMEAIK